MRPRSFEREALVNAPTSTIGIDEAIGSLSASQPGNHMKTSLSSSKPKARHFSFGNSTVDVKDGIWRMHIRERNYYTNGFAIGKLLSEARYPGLEFCRKFHIKALFAVLYFLMKAHFHRIRIPERYLEELRGYAAATGLSSRMRFPDSFSKPSRRTN